MTPIQSIRKFCINCQGGNQKAPALCTNPDCVLFAYREGKNPARKGIGGGKGRKQLGGRIIGTQVAQIIKIKEGKRQEILVTGNKRVIIEDIE